VCEEIGYKTVTPIQLANVVAECRRGKLKLSGLRVWAALLTMQACREAAQRSSRPGGRRAGKNRFLRSEIVALTGLSLRTVTKELRALELGSVASFSTEALNFWATPTDRALEVLTGFSGKRSERRPIPVPRPLLRSLCRCRAESQFLTVLCYVARGLSIERVGGEVRGRGCVKVSSICKLTGLSERAVRYARRELIATGFVTKDTGSFQRKLNRDGAYFEISLRWKGRSLPPEIAPRGSDYRSRFAPPYKNKKTPSEIKNQKTRFERSGFLKTASRKPNLNAVTCEDLADGARLLVLHAEARKKNLIGHSEAELLAFFSAAAHAARVGRENPPGLFVHVLRKKRWFLVTERDEELGRKLLMRSRNGSLPPPTMTPRRKPESDEAHFVFSVLRVAQNKNIDPMLIVEGIRPDWSRERFERAVLEARSRV